VHYNDISIRGFTDRDLFGRTADVQDLKYLDCSDAYSGDYAVCVEHEVPEPCKTMLGNDDIRGVIDHCNFTKSIPPVGIVLPHGGILIQGNDIEISNGQVSIGHKPPIAIYSPDTITIKSEEEDYVFPPAIHIEELILVESKLSKDDIAYLESMYSWDRIWENIEIADYIRYALILLQIVIFPIAITGCYFTVKQRKILNELRGRNKQKKGKENFKNNQYLLRKI
jgi:hypothetical protein